MRQFDEGLNLRKRHPFGRGWLMLNKLQSVVAIASLPNDLDVTYGDSGGQKLDIFPGPKAGSPVFIFIHGGYFRALDKSQYRYIAGRMNRLGYTTVLVNYDLAPAVPASEIIQQVFRSFQWITQNIHKWHGDAAHLHLCGHSVGALLAAKILELTGTSEIGDDGVIKSALLLSGIYDLKSLQQSYLNEDLHLSDDDVRNLSADASLIKSSTDILVAVGGKETGEFIRQSECYVRQLSEHASAPTFLQLEGINHYSMSRLLTRRRSPILRWLVDVTQK